jgi:hypothetical protein
MHIRTRGNCHNRFYTNNILKVRAYCCSHGRWNVGTPFWTEMWVAIQSVVSHNIPKETEIKECAINRKNRGYSLFGAESYYSCHLLAQWTLTANHKVWMQAFVKFVPQEKCKKCFASMTETGHTQMCTPLQLSQNADGQCSALIPQPWPSASDFHPPTSRNTITQMMRQCKTLCVSGYRGSRGILGRNMCPCPKVEEYCCQRWRICWIRNCLQ